MAPLYQVPEIRIGGVLMLDPVSRSVRTAAISYGARSVGLLGKTDGLGMLAGASLAGLIVIALYRFQHRLGPSYVALFAKEGPLEYATFILALLASAWGVSAVWRFSRSRSPAGPSKPVLWMYSALAGALFGFGMEEINWGQTLLGFKTPEAWKAVNYQQETSLHNLLDRNELESSARVIGLLLTVGVIALVSIRVRWPRSLLAQIAPHPALVPLSLCVAYASLKQHSEVVELLVAIFFAFYTYRLWALARAQRPSAYLP